MDKGWVAVAVAVVGSFVLVWTNHQAEAPDGMVLIPGGTLQMGSRGDEGKIGFEIGVDEMPQHEVRIRAFHLDRFEVTNEQYRAFVEATGRPTPADPQDPDYYARGDGPPPPPPPPKPPPTTRGWTPPRRPARKTTRSAT